MYMYMYMYEAYKYMYNVYMHIYMYIHVHCDFFPTETPSNTVTPFVTVNNMNKKQTNTSKQSEQQEEQENKEISEHNQTSVASEDEDKLSSKVVGKGHKAKPTGSKVVVKATKQTKSKDQLVKSKGIVKVMKCSVVAGQRGKAGSRSKKKALLKSAVAAKKGFPSRVKSH